MIPKIAYLFDKFEWWSLMLRISPQVFLSDNPSHGETALLNRLPKAKPSQRGNKREGKGQVDAMGEEKGEKRREEEGEGSQRLAGCFPRRGTLLVFPHLCPHAGMETGERIKILLRGELMTEE